MTDATSDALRSHLEQALSCPREAEVVEAADKLAKVDPHIAYKTAFDIADDAIDFEDAEAFAKLKTTLVAYEIIDESEAVRVQGVPVWYIRQQHWHVKDCRIMTFEMMLTSLASELHELIDDISREMLSQTKE